MARRMTVYSETLPMDARQIRRRTFDADFPQGIPPSFSDPNGYVEEVARFPRGNYYTKVDSATGEYCVFRYPGSSEGAGTVNYRGGGEPLDPDERERSARSDAAAFSAAQRIVHNSRDPATVRGAQDALARIAARSSRPQRDQLRSMNANHRARYNQPIPR